MSDSVFPTPSEQSNLDVPFLCPSCGRHVPCRHCEPTEAQTIDESVRSQVSNEYDLPMQEPASKTTEEHAEATCTNFKHECVFIGSCDEHLGAPHDCSLCGKTYWGVATKPETPVTDPTPELRERLAVAMFGCDGPSHIIDWEFYANKERYLCLADAVLSALGEPK